MSKSRIITMFLGICIVMMSVTACGGAKKDAKVAENLKNVKVITAQKSRIVVESEFAAEIKASEETAVISKVSAKVKEINVEIGSKVKEGDLLFTLDPADVNAQLNQAQAAVELAAASLAKTRNGDASQSVLQSDQMLDVAKSNYDTAREEQDRNKKLYEAGALSKVDLENSKAKVDLAEKSLNTAGKSSENMQKNSTPENIKVAEAQLKQAEAAAEITKLLVGNASVYAPTAGVISGKNIHIGESTAPSTTAVVISNTSVLNAELNVQERLINKFQVGQKVKVTLPAIQNREFEGEINAISPKTDAETQNYKIKVRIVNSTEDLKAGMVAKVKLQVEEKVDVITLPNQAVFIENGIETVYAIKDGKAVKNSIKVGISNDTEVEVLSGIKDGDVIAMESQSFLSEGEKVNVMK